MLLSIKGISYCCYLFPIHDILQCFPARQHDVSAIIIVLYHTWYRTASMQDPEILVVLLPQGNADNRSIHYLIVNK